MMKKKINQLTTNRLKINIAHNKDKRETPKNVNNGNF